MDNTHTQMSMKKKGVFAALDLHSSLKAIMMIAAYFFLTGRRALTSASSFDSSLDR